MNVARIGKVIYTQTIENARKTVSFIWRESMVNISITRDIFSLLMVFSFKARKQFEIDNEISYYVM